MNIDKIKSQIKLNYNVISVIDNKITIDNALVIEFYSDHIRDFIKFTDIDNAFLNIVLEFPKDFKYIKWDKIKSLINAYLIHIRIVYLDNLITNQNKII